MENRICQSDFSSHTQDQGQLDSSEMRFSGDASAALEQCELWTDTAPFPHASVRGSTRPQPVYTHLVRGVAVEECGCPQEHSPPCGKRTTTRWQHTRHSRRESPVGRLVFGQNMLFRTLGGSSGEKIKEGTNKKGKHILVFPKPKGFRGNTAPTP